MIWSVLEAEPRAGATIPWAWPAKQRVTGWEPVVSGEAPGPAVRAVFTNFYGIKPIVYWPVYEVTP